jgi:hypothetical protein
MRRRPRAAFTNRAIAASLTLAVHVLFGLLLLLEKRFPPRELPPPRWPAGIWIHLALPEPRPPPRVDVPRPSMESTPDVPPPADPASTSEPAPIADAPAVGPATGTPTPRTDWYGEADKQAALAAEEADRPATFGRPLQAMREPCKPRDSSFDWSPEEKKAGLLPLPYIIVAERCLITLGFFSCVLGPLPGPNSDLFDDMVAGKTPDSSVPDPNFCD